MRKYKPLFRIIFIILLVSCLAIAASAATYQLGDMDGDLKVNSNDAILLLCHTLSPEKFKMRKKHENTGTW